jgi:hypothetical protein
MKIVKLSIFMISNVIHELVNDIHDLVIDTWQLITPEQQHSPRAPAHLPRNYKVNNSIEGRHRNDKLLIEV